MLTEPTLTASSVSFGLFLANKPIQAPVVKYSHQDSINVHGRGKIVPDRILVRIYKYKYI